MTVPWHRLRDLLAEAVERPPEERDAWLAEQGADDVLRAEVARLLVGFDETGAFDDLLERAAASSLLEHDAVGTSIGPYRILERIGRGGMGDVFLAERTDPVQRVALKLTRPSAGGDADDLRARFLNERRILAQLNHPNIARLYDGGVTDDGRPYFVMEHVEGVALDEYCARMGLDVRARVELLCTICEAVRYAHQHLVVHRDIKPSNVLVTPEGTPKLLDFGIAKLIEEDAETGGATRTELRRISLEYASPEQVRGEPVTAAADVYSLGVLLYRTLTGAAPHDLRGLGLADVVGTLEQAPAPPSRRVLERPQLRHALSGDLDTIVLKALQSDPRRRYPTAGELSDDLDRHLRHRPVLARPDSRAYRWGRFVRRNRMAVSAALLVGLALLGGSGVAVWQASRAAEQARVAEAERDRAAAQAETASAVSEFLGSLFTSADPREALGAEATAQELLDEGRRRIGEGGELTDQPRVRAAMLEIMGGVYRSRGDLDTSLELLAQAVQLQRREGADTVALSLALQALGTTEVLAARTEDAADHLAESIALRRALPRQEDADMARAFWSLGTVDLQRGRLDSAEASLGEAARIYRALADDGREPLSHALDGLGVIARRTGRQELAEARYREALAIREQLLDPRHPDLVRSHNNLAVALAGQRRYAEAEAFARRVVEAWTEVLGPDHFDVAIAKQNLAAIVENLGRPDEAEILYLDALEGKRRGLGSDHPSTALTLSNLGSLEEARGDYRAALDYYRRALHSREVSQGVDHPDVAGVLQALGRASLRQADTSAALAYHERALGIRRGRLPADDASRIRSVLDIVELRLAMGDAAAGAPMLQEHLEARTTTDSTSALMAELRLLDARVLSTLGHSDDAEADLLEASRILRALVDAEAPVPEPVVRRPSDPTPPSALLDRALQELIELQQSRGDDAAADAYRQELARRRDRRGGG